MGFYSMQQLAKWGELNVGGNEVKKQAANAGWSDERDGEKKSRWDFKG